jgi:uncharacterized membrane protein (UPF0127 family)
MQAREDFHKAEYRRFGAILGLLALVVWSVACGPGDKAPPAEQQGALHAEPAPEWGAAPPAGSAWVIFGPDTVVAEVAATPEEREKGLMYRDEVPDGTGMLFVFPDSQVRSFWMKNTYVPLDLAYMDPSFRVVDIVQMEPLVTDTYPSRAPAMYGLEVRQGWLGEHGIAVGAQAEVVFGPPAR